MIRFFHDQQTCLFYFWIASASFPVKSQTLKSLCYLGCLLSEPDWLFDAIKQDITITHFDGPIFELTGRKTDVWIAGQGRRWMEANGSYQR